MALIQVSIIESDTRWAKEIRFFGIPVYLVRELDVRTNEKQKKRPIGFQTIGDVSLLETSDEEED